MLAYITVGQAEIGADPDHFIRDPVSQGVNSIEEIK